MGALSLSGLFSSGHAVDLVIAVMAAEFGLIILLKSARDRPIAAINMLFAMAPGVFILLALRAALTGAGWIWIALFLAASFPIHVADLIRRRIR